MPSRMYSKSLSSVLAFGRAERCAGAFWMWLQILSWARLGTFQTHTSAWDNGTRGLAFINGFNLGWYWPRIGPQGAQYVPGPLLKYGRNEIVLVEVEGPPLLGSNRQYPSGKPFQSQHSITVVLINQITVFANCSCFCSHTVKLEQSVWLSSAAADLINWFGETILFFNCSMRRHGDITEPSALCKVCINHQNARKWYVPCE